MKIRIRYKSTRVEHNDPIMSFLRTTNVRKWHNIESVQETKLTAGFARCFVRGNNRVPAPPPRMIDKTDEGSMRGFSVARFCRKQLPNQNVSWEMPSNWTEWNSFQSWGFSWRWHYVWCTGEFNEQQTHWKENMFIRLGSWISWWMDDKLTT